MIEVIDEAAQAIARACAQLACVIDPHSIVLGGGASAMGDVLLDAVRKAVAQTEPIGPIHPNPRITLARAGNRAGVLGAAALAAVTLAGAHDVSRRRGEVTPFDDIRDIT